MDDKMRAGLARDEAAGEAGDTARNAAADRAAQEKDGARALWPVGDEVALEVIEGPAGTGKTAALAARAAALLEGGARPKSVVVLCASPLACRAFRRRLAATGARDVGAVPILAVRDLELHAVMLERGARSARVLDDFDQAVLRQDLATSGLPERTLRRLLDRCRAQWLEGVDPTTVPEEGTAQGQAATADGDPDLSDLHALLAACLASVDGMLEEELPLRAAEALDGGAAALRFDHVLVDDAQLLSGAGRRFVAGLARRSLAAASDALLAEGPQDAADLGRLVTALQVITADGPGAEVMALAQRVADLIAAGTAPADIALTAAHPAWLPNLARALEARGLGVERAFEEPCGTKRDGLVAEDDPRRQALAALIADGDDPLAWRRWCALGDPLCHSALFAALRRDAPTTPLPQALRALAAGDDPVTPRTALERKELEAVRALAREALEALGESGADAEARSAAHEGALAEPRAEGAVDSEDAPDGGMREDAAACAGGAPGGDAAGVQRAAGVLVCRPDQLVGLRPAVVAVAAFVDGALPCKAYFDPARMEADDQRRVYREALRTAYAALGAARDQAIVSCCTAAPAAQAAALDLKADRLVLRDGERTALLSPSIILGAWK